MKPFEVGKTYKDTAGRDVRIVDDKYQGERLLGIVSSTTKPSGGEFIVCYNSNGDGGMIYSLIPEKEKVEGWVRVWKNADGTIYFGDVFDAHDERRAKNPVITMGGHVLLDVVKIEWEG
jgi:hypothetical protein